MCGFGLDLLFLLLRLIKVCVISALCVCLFKWFYMFFFLVFLLGGNFRGKRVEVYFSSVGLGSCGSLLLISFF